MDKKFITQIIICIFIGGFCGFAVGNYINQQKKYRPFEFYGGCHYSGGGYTRSTSYVLVNKKKYNLDELYEEIYDQFILMNGIPDELIFYLYDTRDNLHSSQHFSTKTYIKSPE